jgi:DNA-binding IclR family transcriptional regulator
MLGGTVARLGDSISRQSPLLKLGTAAVEELSRQCNESVNLAVLDGTDVVYSARHESSYSLRATSILGGRWPAHATALGKALLADLSESDVLRRYGRNPRLRKLTPKTISDLKRLLAELEVVKRAGVAEDREENSIGVRCVAVPIRGASGQAVAALSVSGPISRMTSERINALKSDLRRAGAEFSAKLGFREQQVAQR